MALNRTLTPDAAFHVARSLPLPLDAKPRRLDAPVRTLDQAVRDVLRSRLRGV